MTKITPWLAMFACILVLPGAALAQQVIDNGAQDKTPVRVIELDKANAATVAEALALLLKDKDKQPVEKHDLSALDPVLRDVINTGVKMFNDQMDYAGCYRLFQGSLLTVKPFLSKELQGKIDAGIANAEMMPAFSDRAFELRRVLDEIRASTKAAPQVGKSIDDKKPKVDDKKPKVDDKKPKVEPAGDKGQVAGRLTLDGRPVAGGYFVTLVNADGKKFSSAIQKDGTFQFKTPLGAGKYNVAIDPIPGEKVKAAPLPPRYASDATSGITVTVQAGSQRIELNLVK